MVGAAEATGGASHVQGDTAPGAPRRAAPWPARAVSMRAARARDEGVQARASSFATAETAARAHDAAALALSGRGDCLNFANSAWRMLPILAAGSFGFGSAREIKDAVAVAVVAFQRQQPKETAEGGDDVRSSPTASALSMSMMSSDLLDKQWFGGI